MSKEFGSVLCGYSQFGVVLVLQTYQAIGTGPLTDSLDTQYTQVLGKRSDETAFLAEDSWLD